MKHMLVILFQSFLPMSKRALQAFACMLCHTTSRTSEDVVGTRITIGQICLVDGNLTHLFGSNHERKAGASIHATLTRQGHNGLLSQDTVTELGHGAASCRRPLIQHCPYDFEQDKLGHLTSAPTRITAQQYNDAHAVKHKQVHTLSLSQPSESCSFHRWL